MKRMMWITALVLLAGSAGAQSLQPRLKADTTVKAPLPAYLLTPGATSKVAPASYYQQCFGFFCKQEWMLEKQTRVPVKVRLGNYEYTQRLEGK